MKSLSISYKPWYLNLIGQVTSNTNISIKVLKCGFVDSGSGNQFPGPDWAISGRFPDPESSNVGHFPDPELAFPDLVVVALSQMR